VREPRVIASDAALHRGQHATLMRELVDALIEKQQQYIVSVEAEHEMRRAQGALKALNELKKLLTTAPPA
jgi:predicted DNA-binding protein